ncbi:hypothetical protein V8G54_033313 [Vigna mungo]|uniref:IBR domain-containing protein n=1 Tax=Vigna mungo TaxID=3915 RepID=A0AAQ3RJN0_VIGMU
MGVWSYMQESSFYLKENSYIYEWIVEMSSDVYECFSSKPDHVIHEGDVNEFVEGEEVIVRVIVGGVPPQSIERGETSVDEGADMHINEVVVVDEGVMVALEIDVVREWTRSCAPLPPIPGTITEQRRLSNPRKLMDTRELDTKLMKLAMEKKWQRCPQCTIFVENTGGCEHIACRCGCDFCYICGKKWVFGHTCSNIHRKLSRSVVVPCLSQVISLCSMLVGHIPIGGKEAECPSINVERRRFASFAIDGGNSVELFSLAWGASLFRQDKESLIPGENRTRRRQHQKQEGLAAATLVEEALGENNGDGIKDEVAAQRRSLVKEETTNTMTNEHKQCSTPKRKKKKQAAVREEIRDSLLELTCGNNIAGLDAALQRVYASVLQAIGVHHNRAKKIAQPSKTDGYKRVGYEAYEVGYGEKVAEMSPVHHLCRKYRWM